MKKELFLIALIAAFAAPYCARAQSPSAGPGQAASAGAGQAYPAKPVRIIVELAPGGATDIVARMVAQKLSDSLGRPFVIENRPGAGGSLASALVAKSPPDGYTLLAVSAAYSISPALYPNLSFDPVRDLAPVSRLAESPFLLVAHPSLPVKTVRELIALAKARPGVLNFASAGNGSSGHLTAELFRSMAGIAMTHVPYKGAGPALVEVAAGQVDLMFANILSSSPYVKSGRLRALGVTSAKRSAIIPELPTISESGVRGYEVTSWYGLLAPAGTPVAIVNKLNGEITAIMRTPELQQWFARGGAEPVVGTPEQFGRHIDREIARWRKVVKTAGVRVQ
ncbi:MAG: tripartite tricarboxylate transporter substrate binding protein [Betaproteobacteria bacterium]|nr:tripartite tricarboxylate transporter substrate binding protein [Betaproteobacteria bacterium]